MLDQMAIDTRSLGNMPVCSWRTQAGLTAARDPFSRHEALDTGLLAERRGLREAVRNSKFLFLDLAKA